MKKLTFAFACASTLALFAAPISVATFEAQDLLDKTVGGKTDAGGTIGDIYWQYVGASGSEDSSVVTAYGGENLPVPTGPQLSGTPGSNYLNLSTEGGTLWRSFNASPSDLGAAEEVGERLYIDTMVQFTPTEDDSDPEMATEDKLAIWLHKSTDADGNTTVALKVRAGYYDEGMSHRVATYTLNTAKPVVEGTWYRLSVKAIDNILENEDLGLKYSGFEIRIDGELAKASVPTMHETMVSGLQESELLSSDAVASITAGQFIVSKVQATPGVATTITAVGFKGSGAIDDLVTTHDDLFVPAQPVEFTIETADGVTASWSKTADGEFTAYAAGAKAEPGTIYVKLATADGGVKIVEQTVAASGANAFDLTSETADWSWYLGDAVEGAYVIDDETELEKLAEKAVTLGTDGVTFKLGANIALTKPWAGIGTTNSATDCFKGTFDGQGFKISNVVMKDNGAGKNHYRGFFNQIDGGTVKNLTVESFGFGTTPPSGEYGSAAIAGIANNATIENCVSEGTVASSTHNAGGIVVRIKDTTVKGCTNKANLTGNYTKIAGVVVFCMNSATACLIENCKNEGTLTAVGVDSIKTDDGKDFKAGSDGVAGIIAYVGDGKLTIKDCSNTGALVKGANANSGAKLGQIIGWNHAGVKALEGTITGTTAARMICDMSTPATRHLATVVGGVATLVEDSTIAAGGSYMAMATGCTVTLANVNDSITIDTTLADVTVTTAAENAEVKTEGNVYTVVANAVAVTGVTLDKTTAEITVGGETLTLTATVAPENATDKTVTWETSDAKIATVDGGVVTAVAAGEVTITATAGGKSATCTVTVKAASKPYPAYIADGDKAKYDAWVSTYSVTDRVDTGKALQAAYLLNVAPTEAAAEKDMFAIKSITVDAAGNVNVVPPAKNSKGAAFNGTVEVLGATALDGEWTPKAAGHKFFKAILK